MSKEIIRYVGKKYFDAYHKGEITEIGLVLASEVEKRKYHFIPDVCYEWLNIPTVPIKIVIPEKERKK